MPWDFWYPVRQVKALLVEGRSGGECRTYSLVGSDLVARPDKPAVAHGGPPRAYSATLPEGGCKGFVPRGCSARRAFDPNQPQGGGPEEPWLAAKRLIQYG